jgi:sugar diacid utilization regulator
MERYPVARDRERDPIDDGGADRVAQVAQVAARTAGEAGVSVQLLGEYLHILFDAATEGRRPQPSQLAALRQLGERTAAAGVDADQAVDLYLSAAWRLWRAMPATVGHAAGGTKAAAETMLRVVNEAVDVLIDGHQAARRAMIRQEESVRREFIDDLLRGDADVARLVQRAQPFGLDLSRGHEVLLAEPSSSSPHQLDRTAGPIERAVVDRYGDREVLVATKDTFLVVILPEESGGSGTDITTAGTRRLPAVDFLRTQLRRHTADHHWQVASGAPHPGAYGIAHSYEQAREALRLARRLDLDAATIQPRDLLLYRVIGRDRAALEDLVHGVLTPLVRARGGAAPLLRTLETYYLTGAVATETARRLHVSVRTVTYRLARVETLTGCNPTDPADSLGLQIAVLGARLLDWPTSESLAADGDMATRR